MPLESAAGADAVVGEDTKIPVGALGPEQQGPCRHHHHLPVSSWHLLLCWQLLYDD